jgi:hypothetical protein
MSLSLKMQRTGSSIFLKNYSRNDVKNFKRVTYFNGDFLKKKKYLSEKVIY